MFKRKRKIEFNDIELKIVLYSLNDFRNQLLKEDRYTDAVDEVLVKLKNKMRVDKYDLGAMINALDKRRKVMLTENEDTSVINDLILKLIEFHDNIK